VRAMLETYALQCMRYAPSPADNVMKF